MCTRQMAMTSPSYPPQLEISPYAGPPLSAAVTVPGSKSLTNRALVLAALSAGCGIEGALRSEDTEVMVDCLRRLGWGVATNWDENRIDVWREDSSGVIEESEWVPNGRA